MRLLLISTCGSEGVVALASEAAVLAEERLPGRGASEALLPALRRVLSTSGVEIADLDTVVVVNGPGSFTGVRVGLAAAKGLCQATGTALLALSRLALLAGPAGEVAALLDAGRGEFFCGLYRDGVCEGEALITGEQARVVLAGRRGLACEAAVAAALNMECVAEPGAAAMLRAALPLVERGHRDDLALIDANYLRRTDAELKALPR